MDNSSTIQRISLIGAGNVSTQLAKALFRKGFEIVEIYSLHHENAKLLASKVDAKAIGNISDILDSADLYLIAVPDVQIKNVADQMPKVSGIVAHTSGITPLEVLSSHTRTGVFYPLQTFSKEKEVAFEEIPFCIEGSDKSVEASLLQLAGELSKCVQQITSEERKYLHLAAVFVNNFSNYMYQVAEEILQEKDLDFTLLLPLINETAAKLALMKPASAQTGPARRNDILSMEKHLALLEGKPGFAYLYRLISEQITKKYHGKL